MTRLSKGSCARRCLYVGIALLIQLNLGCSLFDNRYAIQSNNGDRIETLADTLRNDLSFSGELQTQAPLILNATDDSRHHNAPTAIEIAEVYKEAFQLIDDPVAKNKILQRLAALELKNAENLSLISNVANNESIYQTAIAAYSTLLNDPQQTSDRDELHYSLAKAYALKGDASKAYEQMTVLVQSYPESKFWPEAQFRRGEHLFIQGNYRQSANAFEQLIAYEALAVDASETSKQPDQTDSHEFALNEPSAQDLSSQALYMLAWSQFKSSQYDHSIDSFARLIDKHYAYEDNFDSILLENKRLGSTAFEPGHKLVDDAIRGIVLSLSYSSIEDSSNILAKRIANRQFSHRVYSRLAELFYSQERFVDAANIYASYQASHTHSAIAPWFFNQHILLLQHAGYAERALEEKAVFSNQYHPENAYYSNQDNESAKVFVGQRLKIYLDELSSFHHALARKEKENNPDLANDNFATAVYWYQREIAAFPTDPSLGETYFLLGECLQESNQLPDAINAYEMAAYGDYVFDRAAESGYAALLSYNDHIKTIPDTATVDGSVVSLKSQWRYKKVESAQLFAESFKTDTRRNAVLSNSINELEALEDWTAVVEVADVLLATDPNVAELSTAIGPKFSIPAWLASAAATFQLGDYIAAENRYENALSLMDTTKYTTEGERNTVLSLRDSDYQTTLNNYASAIYRQAEQAHANADFDTAIELFDRIVSAAAESDLRPAAQADAIGLLAETKQWAVLTNAIPQFLSDFPQSDKSFVMRQQLTDAHAQLKDWKQAAVLSSSLATDLQAGQYDLKNTERNSAILDLRLAAAGFSLSADDNALAISQHLKLLDVHTSVDERRFETHHTLSQLYAETKQANKQFQQYEKIAALANPPLSQRSSYIAAHATNQLANQEAKNYFKLKIKQPLAKSLRKKRDAMEKAVNAYDKSDQYAVEEFSTLATEKKALIYASFAESIMQSERPAGMDELALEEYEILLEEQAYPFEEQAIELYEINIKRAWQGSKTDAVKTSYRALASLMPARYQRLEKLD